MDITEELFLLQDEKYRKFNKRLVPECDSIGVRIPVLRKLAKHLQHGAVAEVEKFLSRLPHRYLEENHLHAFLLEQLKDGPELLRRTEEFLPHIDNWQTCDSFLPPVFKQDTPMIVHAIERWLTSSRPFTVRYAVRLKLFRKEFSCGDIKSVIKAGHHPGEPVWMASAWYLSMAALHNRAALLQALKEQPPCGRLKKAAARKIRESRQFSNEEKKNFSQLLKTGA